MGLWTPVLYGFKHNYIYIYIYIYKDIRKRGGGVKKIKLLHYLTCENRHELLHVNIKQYT